MIGIADNTYEFEYKPYHQKRRRSRKKNKINRYKKWIQHKKKLKKDYKYRPYEYGYIDSNNAINNLVKAFIDHDEVVGYTERSLDSRHSKKHIKKRFNKSIRRNLDIPSGCYYKKLNKYSYDYDW